MGRRMLCIASRFWRWTLWGFAGLLVWADCAQGAEVGVASAATNQADISRALGLILGIGMRREGFEIDFDKLAAGFRQGYQIEDAREQIRMEMPAKEVIDSHRQLLARKADERREEAAARNREAGQAFLTTNATLPGVTVITNGLQYQVLVEGTGSKPQAGQRVYLNFRSLLPDGRVVQDHAHAKSLFLMSGLGNPAWARVLPMMTCGSKWRVFASDRFAYGTRGLPGLFEPGQAVVWEIELVQAEDMPQPAR